MQKVLVAGGAGFIGSHLCARFLHDGFSVVCVDNLITGSKKNIGSLSSNPQFSFIDYDITKPIQDAEFGSQNFDFIFHLASPASPNAKSPKSYIAFPIETLKVNAFGTYNLLEFAKEKNAVFLYSSTSEVYGDPKVSPQPETYFGNVNPNGIRSVYDEGKRFGEAMTMAFIRKHDLDARIVRIFNTYGPMMQKDDGRVVSNFITQALEGQPITIYGDGKQTRSFCYVDDMIAGLMKAMFSKNTKGEVVNLGNPHETTVKDLAIMIKEMTGSSSVIEFESLPQDDPMQRNPDISKAKKLLDWEPGISLKDGLEKTIAYFKSL